MVRLGCLSDAACQAEEEAAVAAAAHTHKHTHVCVFSRVAGDVSVTREKW
jgi:hypothetical protein